MEPSQEGEQAQPSGNEAQPSGRAAHLAPYQFQPGKSPNPGGIDKETGIPGMRLRSMLREKLERDPKRLDDILELRLSLATVKDHDNPGVTLKAIDDLIDHLDGKLDKGVVNKGEVTVVNIHGPRPLPSPPPAP